MVAPLADQQHACGPSSVHQLASLVQLLGIHPRQQQVVAAVGGGVGDRAHEAQKERVGDVLPLLGVQRDHQPDGAVLAQAQVLCAGIDGVVHRSRQLHDALAGLGVDECAARQRTRHRGHRDPGQTRHVGHLHALIAGGRGRLGAGEGLLDHGAGGAGGRLQATQAQPDRARFLHGETALHPSSTAAVWSTVVVGQGALQRFVVNSTKCLSY